mmetsp:Transcript_7895/g.48809  ORF Transcript_7895/g.48809 Transcript_7895/m.48809 type:complete len:204 (+) Transcript_7895:1064-1675(+)
MSANPLSSGGRWLPSDGSWPCAAIASTKHGFRNACEARRVAKKLRLAASASLAAARRCKRSRTRASSSAWDGGAIATKTRARAREEREKKLVASWHGRGSSARAKDHKRVRRSVLEDGRHVHVVRGGSHGAQLAVPRLARRRARADRGGTWPGVRRRSRDRRTAHASGQAHRTCQGHRRRKQDEPPDAGDARTERRACPSGHA